ncbi:MAG: VOC family protein [Eubacterium sp.]
MATKIFHIFLAVTNLQRSIEFYTKAFEGAKMLYEFTIDGLDICMFSLGNGIVLEMLEHPTVDESDGKWQHIAFECDNIQEQYDRLIAAGATVRMPLEFTTVLKGRNGYPDTECCGVHVLGPGRRGNRIVPAQRLLGMGSAIIRVPIVCRNIFFR